jgi:hypothetical protein
MLKIKSDIVTKGTLRGYLNTPATGKTKKLENDVTQKVLFSNKGKLYLVEAGNLQEK